MALERDGEAGHRARFPRPSRRAQGRWIQELDVYGDGIGDRTRPYAALRGLVFAKRMIPLRRINRPGRVAHPLSHFEQPTRS
jgi:hypothetical protein